MNERGSNKQLKIFFYINLFNIIIFIYFINFIILGLCTSPSSRGCLRWRTLRNFLSFGALKMMNHSEFNGFLFFLFPTFSSCFHCIFSAVGEQDKHVWTDSVPPSVNLSHGPAAATADLCCGVNTSIWLPVTSDPDDNKTVARVSLVTVLFVYSSSRRRRWWRLMLKKPQSCFGTSSEVKVFCLFLPHLWMSRVFLNCLFFTK